MLHNMKKVLLRHRVKYILILIGFCSFTLLLYINWLSSATVSQKCFTAYNPSSSASSSATNNIQLLDDVLFNDKRPTPGRSIIFHETSCLPKSPVHLNARQACAVESAALTNLNQDVFVMFAAPRYLSNVTAISPVIEALLSYPNVHLRNVNLWNYAARSPIYEWLMDGKLFRSKYVMSHTSDFLRYLTLWKWGGTYLDLDVIVKKNLEKFSPNFAGAESKRFVAAGIMNFDHNGFGHEIADLCLRNFHINFDGSDWDTNGPGVITRVLQDICKTNSTLLMTSKRCFGFHVYPKKTFFAVGGLKWEQFFDRKYLHDVLRQTNDSAIVHVLNRLSNKKVISVNSNVAYVRLAQKYCPKVYKSCGDYI